MKLKEAQLLGVLAVIAGAIVVLSLWSGRTIEETSTPPQADQMDSQPAEELTPESVVDWLRMREAEDELADTFSSEPAETADAADTDEATVAVGEGRSELEMEREIEEAEAKDIAMQEALARLDDTVTGPSLSTGAKVHTVKAGDTLSEISAEYYGTCRKWPQILQANSSSIRTPGELRVGMKLVIPALAEPVAATTEKTEPAGPATPAGGRTYLVRKGDTLIAISRKHYGTPSKWKIILEANRRLLDDARDLRPGMELFIPAVAGVAISASKAVADKAVLSARMEMPGVKYYDVQKGDTLWTIAQNAYGDASRWKDILEANKDLMKSASDLRPNMRLILP